MLVKRPVRVIVLIVPHFLSGTWESLNPDCSQYGGQDPRWEQRGG